MLAYILALAVGIGSIGLYLAAFFFPEVHRKTDFIWSSVGLLYALVLWVCAGRITGGVLLGQIASVALLGWLGWETVKLRRELTPAAEQTAIPSSEAVQDKLTNLSIPERITGLFTSVKDKAQQTLGGLTKGKSETKQPSLVELIDKTSAETEVATPPAPTTPTTAPTPATPPAPAISTAETATPATAPAPTASTAEIATPATASAPTASTAEIATPTPAPTTQTAEDTQTAEEETPELIRPHPPAPELVEAALEDAEEKHIPADPPEPEPQTSVAHQELDNPPNPT